MSDTVHKLECCGTCRWYVWATGPTGRRRPSQRGTCGWRAAWPEVWPKAFRDPWAGRPPRHPQPAPTWPGDGYDCPVWDGREAEK